MTFENVKTASVCFCLLILWEWSGGDSPGWIPTTRVPVEKRRETSGRRSICPKPLSDLVTLKVIRPP